MPQSNRRPRWWGKVVPPHNPQCMPSSSLQPCPVGAKAICPHALVTHGCQARGSVPPYICQSNIYWTDRSRHILLQCQHGHHARSHAQTWALLRGHETSKVRPCVRHWLVGVAQMPCHAKANNASLCPQTVPSNALVFISMTC